jgi:flagellar motor switch/type III secretory pathway protein FliN
MVDEEILDGADDITLSKKKSGAIDMSAVKVQLKCEVGVVNISMAELSNIKVGDMVEFGKWPNTVKLILNNSCIAEGYLIEVQGMLAVKIEQVY